MARPVRPLRGLLLVKRLEPKPGLLTVVSHGRDEEPIFAEVLAIGPGRRWRGKVLPVAKRPGDRVVFGPFAGEVVNHDGDEIIFVREEALLGDVEGFS